ncbi:porin family protein [Seonamhaeicola aphaedonensis]|uniref:Outer membrane protein with beta-barrel domain n=1 Tax=Seonamhaeicola aphaedonensis TaxID=1461338 RepID=A0A3D9HHE4_9FLAO|nr:hypothetical protein [Seonamhaeicola aphaedonensis]RED48893.1 hypothetical protein DFQ02_103224 [Seonamhaeicola aphaedonensis]
MGEKKHIDRLFQEGLKDFEASPSRAVWKNIEANLNKKKKRRVIPIWWRYAGVAALLLLLLTIAGIFKGDSNTIIPAKIVTEDIINTTNTNTKTPDSFDNNNTVIVNSGEGEQVISESNFKNTEPPLNNVVSQSETTIAGTAASKNVNESIIVNKLKGNLNKEQNTLVTVKNKTETGISNNLTNNNAVALAQSEDNSKKLIQNKAAETNSVLNNNLVVQNENDPNENKSEAIAENKKEDIETHLTIEEALEESRELLEDTKKTNRWAVVPNAAPVYFNTLGEGSSIDQQFNGNPKSGDVNMSYGITASYALNDKISIRSGINKVNLGYNTNNVVVFQTTGLSSSVNNSLQNISTKSNSNQFATSENISFVSGESLNKSSVPESFALTNSSINQSFGFIEVPLEIQYALSNNKFGVNVIGGFSSFFLNSNEIFSEAENGSRTFLGEATNLNKISYSANFGFGFRYKFSEKIDLNLEPMFKYQINTFNNTSGNFTPIIIGVYTGFAIKF